MVYSFLGKNLRRWWCATGLALTLIGCSAGGVGAPGAQTVEGDVLTAPLKIPMPLDKAGHKIDVTFDIPEPHNG